MDKKSVNWVEKARPYAKKVLAGGGVIIAVVLIFTAGVAVGNGQIVISKVSPSSSNKDLPNQLNYTEINELYSALKSGYDGKLDQKKLIEGMKQGMVSAAGDPYTEYMDAAQAKDFSEQLSGSFTGIGAELGQDNDKNLIVVAPISGFPADKAGVRAQDMILAIDGKSTKGMSVDEAVKLIRGPKDTQVKLDIMRNANERESLSITRDDIKIPSVKTEVLDGNIGYMQITQFGGDTADLAHKAAREFKDQGVEKVIVDVRDNPGGLLDASVQIASLWLKPGTTILQEKRDGKVLETYKADGDPLLKGIPTVVLLNKGSASASEILAGALKDNKAATLMGEKSYGKGSVQQIQSLSDGELKVTVARWYRPNGQNIDKKGIEPDKTVPMTEDDYKNDLDPQKDAAAAYLQGQ